MDHIRAIELPYDLVKHESLYHLAKYITSAQHSAKDKMAQRHGRWVRHLLRKLRRVCRRLSQTFEQSECTHLGGKQKTRKKPGVNERKRRREKCGISIPNKYTDAVELDIANGNTLWQTAVQVELAALIYHDCFKFKSRKYKYSKEYQFASLRFMFEMKQDLRRRARLVIQGFKVDPRDLETRSIVVKGISVRLLDVITHQDKLKNIKWGHRQRVHLSIYTRESVHSVRKGMGRVAWMYRHY